jgi:hypothetical protein
MSKSYPKVLGEWVKQRESAKRDAYMVAFLAVREDVKDALAAGYSVKTIWTNMHEERRVSFGYDTFLNYVNRHIRRAAKELAKTEVQTGRAQSQAEQRPAPVPQARQPDPIAGFTFNSAPKKEDLL